MNRRKESVPAQELLDAVRESVLLPAVQSVARDARKQIELEVAVFTGEELALKMPPLHGGSSDADLLSGQMRIRFREAIGGRVLMYAEVVFDRRQATANCSGFSLKADIREGVAKRTAFTVRYSVWDWTGWV